MKASKQIDLCRIRFVSEDINRMEVSCTHRPLALWGLSVFCPTCIYQALRALHPGGIVATETTLVTLCVRYYQIFMLSMYERICPPPASPDTKSGSSHKISHHDNV